jgi:hypothetical protein
MHIAIHRINRMKNALRLLPLAMAAISASTSAQVNSWINPASGTWDQAVNWSLGILPDSSQSVMITNAGFKAVAINPSTPIDFPGSMTVNSLTVRGATNTVNSLLLNFFGTGVPLTVLNGLTVADSGQILNFNSYLYVPNGQFLVTNAQVIQDGGLVRITNATLNLFNSDYHLTNGIFEASAILIGVNGPSHFHQYGGTAAIGNVGFSYSTGPGTGDRGIVLHGGILNLPFGFLLEGRGGSTESYLQDGGTNYTSNITLQVGLTGPSPDFTLNGGLLVDNNVHVNADTIATDIQQNGGTHIVSNILKLTGGTRTGTIRPASYQLNNGTLSASNIVLESQAGDARFFQSNGIVQAGQIQANGYYANHSEITLAGGTLSCSNLVMTDGAQCIQSGGALVVSNTLAFSGFRSPGPNLYSRYTLLGGTLSADNIYVGGDWIIGDSATSRISNPGSCTLAHFLQIGNAVEQLGQCTLASDATIDLAGSASRLSFADSSSEPWAPTTLTVLNWNGDLSGGGAEQLKFGPDQFGLTPIQLSRIQFSIGTTLYAAKILNTGEVVPDQGLILGLVNAWTNPGSGNWDQASNWSLGVLPDSSQVIAITNSGWKAVSINPSTPINFPGSMTISNLVIRGSTNTQNTLLLNYFGTTVPLTVSNGMTLANDGRIVNFDSGLELQSGWFLLTNSTMSQDGGFVRMTNATMYLQNGVYEMTNGVFQGGVVNIGMPNQGQFNQYSGTVTIANLGFGQGGGGYSLHGGTLDLPGGFYLPGRPGGVSYFQAGGTNRTPFLDMEDDSFGSTPSSTVNGGLLAVGDVIMRAGRYARSIFVQNGGTHMVTNALSIFGGAQNAGNIKPAEYFLNGGTLSARVIELDANHGDSRFVQTNGTVHAEIFSAHSVGYFGSMVVDIMLENGSLSCSNFTLDDGRGSFNQNGGTLVVSNLLDIRGYRDLNIRYYGSYVFNGGAVTASNINIAGNWHIGNGSTNRITNAGFFSLAHYLYIGDAVEQLGRFILGDDAMINLAGSASRLSFANSSGETWNTGSGLLISNWNGSFSGGGAEQLKFGTSESGLTPTQLSHIQFVIGGSNYYSAKILSTGEVVPDQPTGPRVTFSSQDNNLVLAWPSGWTLQSATNVLGPYLDVPGATSPYTKDMKLNAHEYFRLRQ